MSALELAIEDLGDSMMMDYLFDSIVPAYCATCGDIGELEPDFRGPCFNCGDKDCGSIMDLLGVI